MPIARNPNGARTDAERRAQNKWEQKNRVTLGVRLSKADGESFRAWCAARGLTVNAALTSYVAACLQSGDGGGNAAGVQQLQKCADVADDLRELAAAAAAAAGEDVPAFVARAIRQTADADERTRRYAQASPARRVPQEIAPAVPLGDQLKQRVQRLKQVHEERGHRDERGTSEPIGDPADPGASDKKAAQDAPKAP